MRERERDIGDYWKPSDAHFRFEYLADEDKLRVHGFQRQLTFELEEDAGSSWTTGANTKTVILYYILLCYAYYVISCSMI